MIKLENIFLPSWESYLECSRIQNNKLKLAKKRNTKKDSELLTGDEGEEGRAKFQVDGHLLAYG